MSVPSGNLPLSEALLFRDEGTTRRQVSFQAVHYIDYQSSSLSSSSEPPMLSLRWFNALASALAKSLPPAAGAAAAALDEPLPILGEDVSCVSVFLRSLTLLPWMLASSALRPSWGAGSEAGAALGGAGGGGGAPPPIAGGGGGGGGAPPPIAGGGGGGGGAPPPTDGGGGGGGGAPPRTGGGGTGGGARPAVERDGTGGGPPLAARVLGGGGTGGGAPPPAPDRGGGAGTLRGGRGPGGGGTLSETLRWGIGGALGAGEGGGGVACTDGTGGGRLRSVGKVSVTGGASPGASPLARCPKKSRMNPSLFWITDCETPMLPS